MRVKDVILKFYAISGRGGVRGVSEKFMRVMYKVREQLLQLQRYTIGKVEEVIDRFRRYLDEPDALHYDVIDDDEILVYYMPSMKPEVAGDYEECRLEIVLDVEPITQKLLELVRLRVNKSAEYFVFFECIGGPIKKAVWDFGIEKSSGSTIDGRTVLKIIEAIVNYIEAAAVENDNKALLYGKRASDSFYSWDYDVSKNKIKITFSLGGRDFTEWITFVKVG